MWWEDIRKICKERRKIREQGGEPSERETLVPCPACKGRGSLHIEEDSGEALEKIVHLRVLCPWCEGLGSVDNYTVELYDEFTGA